VGSPGDVRAEREAVHRVCDELNRTAVRDRGLVLEMAGSDTDAYPRFHPEGPQGLIDACPRIEDCRCLRRSLLEALRDARAGCGRMSSRGSNGRPAGW